MAIATVQEVKNKIAQVREQMVIYEEDIEAIDMEILDLNVLKTAAEESGKDVAELKAKIRALKSESRLARDRIESSKESLYPLGYELQQAEKKVADQAAAEKAVEDNAIADAAAKKAAEEKAVTDAAAAKKAAEEKTLADAAAAKEAELNNTPGSAGSGAPTQSPALPPANVNERLNTQQAAALAGETETGTNPPVKKLTETQSVSPDANSVMKEYVSANKEELNTSAGEYTVDYGNIQNGNQQSEYVRPGEAAGPAGAGATGEDGATATNTTRILNSFNKKTFEPQPNVLDQYASYTYNIGWYLLKPDAYTEMQKSHKPVPSNYSLLIQSGGAASDVGDIKNNIVGRSPFFKNDFYLDNLKIESTVSGKGSNQAFNSVSLEFTVTEPANITLIDNLWKAVNDQYKDQDPKTKEPYATAFYALVIRFYGYDSEGKLVQAGNNGAVVEKIIPFRIADIGFSVTNKLVEYTVKGTATPYQIGFGSDLGTVKSSVKISGATVKDLLTNGVVLAEVSPDDGRKPAPVAYGSATTNNGITNTGNEGGSFSDGGLDSSDSLIGA
tara:strand:+ start:3694 stop:5367 length:1674 start_codon:yes stop_codon:yes gene_type:complete